MKVENKENKTFHYVYLLKSKVSEMNYIGVRSCKCEIGKDKYMGSSTVMTKEDKDNCHKIILGRFNTRKEALLYEIEMHNKFEVAVNEQFWNKSKQTTTFFNCQGIKYSEERKAICATSFKGRKHTKESIERMSKSKLGNTNNLGKKFSKEHKEKISIAHIGKKVSKETRERMSISFIGRVLSEEHKLKISKPIICVETNIKYKSIKEASIITGINEGNINCVLKLRRERAGGYRWKYL